MDLGVGEHSQSETTLGAKMTKLKLSHFEDIMKRQGSLEKAIMLEKWKAAGKEED